MIMPEQILGLKVKDKYIVWTREPTAEEVDGWQCPIDTIFGKLDDGTDFKLIFDEADKGTLLIDTHTTDSLYSWIPKYQFKVNRVYLAK